MAKAGAPRKPRVITNMSPKALKAAKAFKGLAPLKAPAKLMGPNAAAIKRAVRSYFFG